MEDNRGVIEGILAMIPVDIYGSVISGGFTLILAVSLCNSQYADGGKASSEGSPMPLLPGRGEARRAASNDPELLGGDPREAGDDPTLVRHTPCLHPTTLMRRCRYGRDLYHSGTRRGQDHQDMEE